jgi:branched-chain amino acid transport system ATP-binding protein
LFDVSLKVAAGEVAVLIGRNGAGKTTTLKAILGLIGPRRGRILFKGEDVSRWPVDRLARAGLGYVAEERRIFTQLTVAENLAVGARAAAGADAGWTVERLVGLFPNLATLLDRSAGRISGGEQQMLAIARTLMGNPDLVLLDEPSEGLAPLIVARMAEAVLAMKRAGLSILLAEQSLAFARAVGDRAYVLEKGCIVAEGPVAGLLADERVMRTHLAV